MRRKLFPAALLLLTAALPQTQALAQNFPSKPIRFIVPYSPGGSTDPIVRIIGQKLLDSWGHQTVVDYRAGAGGNLASEVTAKAPPDGYTILLATVSTICINPALYRDMTVDTVKDLAPVTLVASGAYVLVVHPSLPVNSVKDLIALGRQKPGQLNYASGGSGGAPHLSMELMKSMAKVDFAHIPYKGAGPAMVDVLAGQVPIMFGSVTSVLQYVKTGRMKALAVTTQKRSAMLDGVPTIAESGLPGFDVDAWYGVVVPAATPANIVAELNRAIVNAVQSTEVKDRFAGLGLAANTSTPEAFAKIIRSDLDKWASVVKTSGARVD